MPVLDWRSLIAYSSVAHISTVTGGIICCKTQSCDIPAENPDVYGKTSHCWQTFQTSALKCSSQNMSEFAVLMCHQGLRIYSYIFLIK
jgi:NADH:ubiquinone oxidoreductase subunit 4 (subunit M)